MSKLGLEGILSKAMEKMPLFKVGEKWDIAMAAVYLASDAG
jgi:peroxisomal 2,4-dienoyl-CoA reductase